MPKEKISLNSIYISERLQKSLQPVSNSALTAITAPMGYGKTTAVNWYLSRLAKDTQALLIRISIYSQNLSIFWKSCLLYTSPSPRDRQKSRMPSSA